ncbi:MAG: DUF6673 family protein [Clostridia bacterium]
MKINNVELEDLDIFDLETAEKYEDALGKVIKESKETEGTELVEGTALSSTIRKQCNSVFKCFNTIFGEDTDKKVFGNKTNIMVCLKAFEELVLQVDEQKKELDKMTSKYSPNRVQRRSKK